MDFSLGFLLWPEPSTQPFSIGKKEKKKKKKSSPFSCTHCQTYEATTDILLGGESALLCLVFPFEFRPPETVADP